MQYSINVPNFGDFADPRVVADVARLAEDAGWDGLIVWDHLIGYNRDLVADFAATNLLLTAAALTTNRIRLGTMVTPVPRRGPRQLAREIATLDQLSGGRVIFGVALGNPVENEYGRFAEPTDARVLAGMLDEGLEAITLHERCSTDRPGARWLGTCAVGTANGQWRLTLARTAGEGA